MPYYIIHAFCNMSFTPRNKVFITSFSTITIITHSASNYLL